MTDLPHIPTGNYPAHTAAHILDLEATADRLLAQLPGHRRQTETLAREGGTSVVMMAMEAGDEVREHSAPGTVSVQTIRGHAVLSTGGSQIDLRAGNLAFMQPAVRHHLRAETQAVVLLTVGMEHG